MGRRILWEERQDPSTQHSMMTNHRVLGGSSVSPYHRQQQRRQKHSSSSSSSRSGTSPKNNKSRRNNNTAKPKRSPSSSRWLNRQSSDVYAQRAQTEHKISRSYFKLEQIDDWSRVNPPALLRKRQRRRRRGDDGDDQRRTGGERTPRRPLAVIDLGASPGGWTSYVSETMMSGPYEGGILISVDLLPLDPNAAPAVVGGNNKKKGARTITTGFQFEFIQGDFTLPSVQRHIVDALARHGLRRQSSSVDEECPANGNNLIQPRADVILTDMASNFTGDKRTDALRTLALCEDALKFAVGPSYFMDDVNNNDNFGSDDERAASDEEVDGMLAPGGAFLCKLFSSGGGGTDERDLMDVVRRRFGAVDVIKPPASRKDSAERYLLARGYRPHLRSSGDGGGDDDIGP